MISYVILGTNDLQRAAGFFDPLFGVLNGSRAFTLDNMVAYTFGSETPMIVITAPYDGASATSGNGSMIALKAADRDQVDQIHALALDLGASDEGAPGPRGKTFYGGYFRDLDGNKFNISLSG